MIFNSILDILFVMIFCILFKSSVLGGLLWHQASGSAIVLLPGGGEGPCFWLSVCWNPLGGRLGRVEVQIPHQGPLTSPWGTLLLLPTWPVLALQEEESVSPGRNESLGFSNAAPEVVWMPQYSSVEYKSRHPISSDIVGMAAPHCSWAEWNLNSLQGWGGASSSCGMWLE